MTKFMFFAFTLCAIYPGWPVDAVHFGQALVESLQPAAQVVQLNAS